MINKLFNFYSNQKTWGLLIGSDLNNLKTIKQPFWTGRADPFIYNFENKLFILFEEINIITRKGKICLAELNNNRLVNKTTVLQDQIHLSFPFIFNCKYTYLIPESHQRKTVELYNFNMKTKNVKFVRNLLTNIECVDSIMYYYEKKYWLITTQKSSNDNFNDLYVYSSNDLLKGKFIPHKDNPVIVNSNTSRNAGSIIKKGNSLFRVSQDCKTEYGKSISINRIISLSNQKYEESDTIRLIINNNQHKNHSYNELNGLIISDYKFKINNPLILVTLVIKRVLQKLCLKI